MTAVIEIRIQEADFSLQGEYDRLRTTRSGAIVTFTGLVRDFDEPDDSGSGDNGGVKSLFLQHYPGMTEKLLREIVEDACQRWPVDAATVIHRVGNLAPGDQIVLVAVSAAHREAAFAAASFIMDYLKTRATFWKKTTTDSDSRWVEMKDSDRAAARRWQGPGGDGS